MAYVNECSQKQTFERDYKIYGPWDYDHLGLPYFGRPYQQISLLKPNFMLLSFRLTL